MTTIRAAGLLLSVAAFAGIGAASDPAPRAADHAPRATSYKIDKVHSSNVFRIKHLDTSYFHGRFNDMDGAITWNEADPAASTFAVEIKASSVDTNSQGRDNHLKSADFFNAAQFPSLTFTSTGIEKSGDSAYKLTGDLTIHGVTRPITVDLAKTGAGKNQRGRDLIGFETTFTIKRTDFDMRFMVGPLGDEVRVTVSIEAAQQ